jgi:hypothetical protein
VPSTRRKPRGPARSKLAPVVIACDQQCGREHVGWAHLRPRCAQHFEIVPLAPNCSHAATLTVEGYTMCSWCGGHLKTPETIGAS